MEEEREREGEGGEIVLSVFCPRDKIVVRDLSPEKEEGGGTDRIEGGGWYR